MNKLERWMRIVAAVFTLVLFSAACASAGADTGGGGASLSISSPADGATVSEPFTVKLDASVPIGEPSTGENHVHLCFDGASCDDTSTSVISYTDSVKITDLEPGTHTIEVSLRNADHSDTGVSTSITITVNGTGSGTGNTSGSTGSGMTGSSGSDGGRGYGY